MHSQRSNKTDNHEEDEGLQSKMQSKIKSGHGLNVSQFLGSISKMDDGYTERLLKMYAGDPKASGHNHNSDSSNFNDSKNNKDLEMLLKTCNQSKLNQIKENKKEEDLGNSLN